MPPIIGHHQGPRHPLFCPGPIIWVGLTGERLGINSPSLDIYLSAKGATAPCGNIVPYLHTHWGGDPDLDRVTMPDHGCRKTACCGHHIRVGWKCNDSLSVQKPQLTLWVLLAQPYTQLDQVLLFEGSGKQQSAITLGGNQNANSVCNPCIIIMSQVHFH